MPSDIWHSEADLAILRTLPASRPCRGLHAALVPLHQRLSRHSAAGRCQRQSLAPVGGVPGPMEVTFLSMILTSP